MWNETDGIRLSAKRVARCCMKVRMASISHLGKTRYFTDNETPDDNFIRQNETALYNRKWI